MGAPNPDDIYRRVAPLLCKDVDDLAPGMRDPVHRALAECERLDLQVVINETYRCPDVQRLYYAIGRDTVTGAVVGSTVTNAATAAKSWHGYRLAVDIRHATRGYPPDSDPWWAMVAEVFRTEGQMAWGGHWRSPDRPHFQPAVLPASPTPEDQADFARGALGDVWTRYNLGCEP